MHIIIFLKLILQIKAIWSLYYTSELLRHRCGWKYMASRAGQNHQTWTHEWLRHVWQFVCTCLTFISPCLTFISPVLDDCLSMFDDRLSMFDVFYLSTLDNLSVYGSMFYPTVLDNFTCLCLMFIIAKLSVPNFDINYLFDYYVDHFFRTVSFPLILTFFNVY